MKILLMGPGDSPHLGRTLRWLLDRGCEMVVTDYLPPEGFSSDACQYIRLPRMSTSFFKYLGGMRLAYRLGEWRAGWLRRLWQRVQPQVVNVQWVDLRAYHAAVADIHPLVLTVYGSDINNCFTDGAEPEYNRLIGKALAAADRILVDAPDMITKCEELAEKKLPCELITLGVNTELFRPGYREEAAAWRRQLDIPADACVFLSQRFLRPLYRPDRILEAFALALPTLPREAKLVLRASTLTGQRDAEPLQQQLRERADELGISSAIRWLPRQTVNELPAVYAFADVIVNYPERDAFPVTFLEAAACERPVISCRQPSYDGSFAEEYFRLVNPNDIHELAAAMVEAAGADPQQTAAKMADARALMVREYDEAAIVDRLLALYRELSGLA